ncbi:MAG: ABC transporter ATP-binding protein [Candidatus Thermoplasmatota archaeon]|nr:ABC transporter ATP-binding protein [Candidatus Thermoplasmatota archaeon]MBU1940516.1 ABC transporter ATP-binding protein [Candidatus Thermoplasmatota archaeon]
MGKQQFRALNNVSLSIHHGDFIALMGPSGSGKSTLMNIIGCLDRPTSGDVVLAGEHIAHLSDNQLAEIRNRKIGFIFQTFNLIPTLPAFKNVSLPMVFSGIPRSISEARGRELLGKMGMVEWAHHRPSELSGGQQQRVAIARALANDPAIILADEPTGNLDTVTGTQVMDFLKSVNKTGKTIVLVTHDSSLKRYANRVVMMKDGSISERK